jgi:hypothetical protein
MTVSKIKWINTERGEMEKNFVRKTFLKVVLVVASVAGLAPPYYDKATFSQQCIDRYPYHNNCT